MSAISALLKSNNGEIDSVNKEIAALVDEITVSSISRDPSLKYTVDENADVQHADLMNESLAQLTTKVSDIDTGLVQLNELWIIKNLLQEIKVGLNPLEEEGYLCDKDDLESVLTNLTKVKSRVALLDKGLIIRSIISQEISELQVDIVDQILRTFETLFPHPCEFRSNVDDSHYSLLQFLSISERYPDLHLDQIIKSFIRRLQKNWDNEVLVKLCDNSYILELQRTEESVKLALTPNHDGFSDLYFKSIENFMSFVDIVDNQNLRNVFLSKISHSLMQVISQNITTLMNSSNGSITNELVNLVNVARETYWSFSIGSTFKTSQNIHEKLAALHFEWIEDKYIDQIRLFFRDDFAEAINNRTESKAAINKVNESEKKAPAAQTEGSQNDDWDDQWNEDGWDEEIKDDWNWGDEENERTPVTPVAPTKDNRLNSSLPILLSGVPSKLERIINDFKAESMSEDIKVLVSTIQSLLLVYYPTMNETFLLYNDLKHMGGSLSSQELSNFADTLWSQTKLKFTNQVVELVLAIDLQHDDFVAATVDLDQFELDDDNWNHLNKLNNWFKSISETDLQKSNQTMFHDLFIDMINLINTWIANSIIRMNEITEYQSIKITVIVDMIQNVTLPQLQQVNDTKENVDSFHKLDNVIFLTNNHMKEIKERFYDGEFFDLQTNELTSLIKALFVQSEARDSLITEITEFRTMAE